jgi:hypothetical protein
MATIVKPTPSPLTMLLSGLSSGINRALNQALTYKMLQNYQTGLMKARAEEEAIQQREKLAKDIYNDYITGKLDARVVLSEPFLATVRYYQLDKHPMIQAILTDAQRWRGPLPGSNVQPYTGEDVTRRPLAMTLQQIKREGWEEAGKEEATKGVIKTEEYMKKLRDLGLKTGPETIEQASIGPGGISVDIRTPIEARETAEEKAEKMRERTIEEQDRRFKFYTGLNELQQKVTNIQMNILKYVKEPAGSEAIIESLKGININGKSPISQSLVQRILGGETDNYKVRKNRARLLVKTINNQLIKKINIANKLRAKDLGIEWSEDFEIEPIPEDILIDEIKVEDISKESKESVKRDKPITPVVPTAKVDKKIEEGNKKIFERVNRAYTEIISAIEEVKSEGKKLLPADVMREVYAIIPDLKAEGLTDAEINHLLEKVREYLSKTP